MLQFCIHSPINGHVGCFLVWAFANKATMNSSVKTLYGYILSFLLGKYVGVEWLYPIGVCVLFSETENCLWKWLYHFTLPPAENEISISSMSSSICSVFSNCTYLKSCEVVYHCSFHLLFSND